MLRIKRSVAAQYNTATNVAVFRAATETGQQQASSSDAMAVAEKVRQLGVCNGFKMQT